jgi:hypothetical protein
LLRVVLAILVTFVGAAAASPTTTRVVLADPDPELQRALVDSLAPWRLEVIVDAPAPANTEQAEARARAKDARFVVWRRDGDLVVFDRERGAAEHREGTRGKLDVPGATAAALTVKTLMRLPPPATIDLTIAPNPAVVVVAPEPPGPELRVQTGLATRVARGSTTELGARAGVAAFVRPWGTRGLRFGVAGEFGTSSGVEESGFKGRWSDWTVLALASWSHALGRWELEPFLGAGITRSGFSGTEGTMERDESDTVIVVRAGVWVRRQFGPWSFGPSVVLDGAPSTPTYTKKNGNGDLFTVPAFAIALGVLAAVDFR